MDQENYNDIDMAIEMDSNDIDVSAEMPNEIVVNNYNSLKNKKYKLTSFFTKSTPLIT